TIWTWSAVVLPIFTIASVIAAVISRFCWSVRPAYHWIVMFGMASLLDLSARLGRRRSPDGLQRARPAAARWFRFVAAIIAAGRPPGKAAPPLGNSRAPSLSNSDDRTTSAAGKPAGRVGA